jgi:hypothetical protein
MQPVDPASPESGPPVRAPEKVEPVVGTTYGPIAEEARTEAVSVPPKVDGTKPDRSRNVSQLPNAPPATPP